MALYFSPRNASGNLGRSLLKIDPDKRYCTTMIGLSARATRMDRTQWWFLICRFDASPDLHSCAERSRMCPSNHQLTGILAGETAFLRKYCRNRCQESRARYLHVAVEVYSNSESGFLLIRSSNRNLVPVFLAAHRRCCSDWAGLNTIEGYSCEKN